MRGFGDYHRNLAHHDARVAELFSHLRRALDVFEQIMLRPYQPISEAKPQPPAPPEKPKPEISKPETPQSWRTG
jgi:hypothetical protein